MCPLLAPENLIAGSYHMGSYVQALRSVLVVAFTPDVSLRMNDILTLRIIIKMIKITVWYFSDVVGLFTTKSNNNKHHL